MRRVRLEFCARREGALGGVYQCTTQVPQALRAWSDVWCYLTERGWESIRLVILNGERLTPGGER